MTCLLATAVLLTFWTAMPKLPVKVPLHPAGADAAGAMSLVTACGAAKGDAFTTAARARRATA